MDQPTPTPSDQPASTGQEQASGTLSQVLGFGGSLIDKNDPVFKPLVTVMVIVSMIFLGMLVFAYQVKLFDKTTESGVAGNVFWGTFGCMALFVIVAGITTMARSFIDPGKSGTAHPTIVSPKLTEAERDLLNACKWAEKGIGVPEYYLSKPFKLNPDEVRAAIDRLSQLGG